MQSSSEIELKYKHLMNLPENSNYTPLNFYGNAYDAMWAMAIGLDNADRRAKAGDDSGCRNLQGELVPLNMFNYTNNKMGCMMKNGYATVNFTGITVTIMHLIEPMNLKGSLQNFKFHLLKKKSRQ